MHAPSSTLPQSNRQRSKQPEYAARSSLISDPNDIKPRRENSRAWNQPGEMEMLGTVSRSGGFGDEGDALKDTATQERFWEHINLKLDSFHDKFSALKEKEIPTGEALALEMLNNILLLLRKLREGIMASHRKDHFAIKVYETSALLAIQAGNHPQLISSLSVLAPGMYKTHDRAQVPPATDIPISAFKSLSLDANSPSLERSSRANDHRSHFTSLLLLYQICQLDSPAEFNRIFFFVTSSNFLLPSDPDLLLARSAYSALTNDSPLVYSQLLFSSALSAHQQIVLSWGVERLRGRIWAVARSSYISVPLDWVGRLLLFWEAQREGRERERNEWTDEKVGLVIKWVQGHGARVDGQKVFVK